MSPDTCPQLDRQGVRMFLLVSRENAESAGVLRYMLEACKQLDTPQAHALRRGWLSLREQEIRAISELRQRGGLLHLGHAVVELDDDINYVVRCAA